MMQAGANLILAGISDTTGTGLGQQVLLTQTQRCGTARCLQGPQTHQEGGIRGPDLP